MANTITKDLLKLLRDGLNDDRADGEVSTKKSKDATKVSTSRMGKRKEVRRLQKQAQEKAQNRRNRTLWTKSKIEKYQEEQLQLKAESSAQPVVTQLKPMKYAQKVFDNHMQRLDRRNQVEVKKKEESTVFTDKDFDKFEEEYDFWNA